MSNVIDDKGYAKNQRNEKTDHDKPREGQFKFGFSEFFFDFGVFC
jgi:hypothetical protein